MDVSGAALGYTTARAPRRISPGSCTHTHTHIHTYIHTFILHSYIQTYMHTHTPTFDGLVEWRQEGDGADKLLVTGAELRRVDVLPEGVYVGARTER
jgi:hypothetical protein